MLLAFAIAGKWIFKFLGITMPAFQLAASIVLLLVALDMLRAQRSRVQETSEETAAGAEKTDIAVTPLAIPMLAGPGAISTAILLHNQAANIGAARGALPLHPGRVPGELSDPAHLRARRPLAQPHRHEHHRAHHGPAPGGGGDAVHAQRVPAIEPGLVSCSGLMAGEGELVAVPNQLFTKALAPRQSSGMIRHVHSDRGVEQPGSSSGS